MRLFAAVALAEATRTALHAWAVERFTGQDGLRILPRESLHITLVFLGERPAEEIPRIATALADLPSVPPSLAIAEVAHLPNPRRPTVLVADVAPDAALTALRAEVARRLAPFHEPDARPYRPHITLARVRRTARPRTGVPPSPPSIAVVTAGVTLYRSHPGSRYEALT